jgi:hypothetical protein
MAVTPEHFRAARLALPRLPLPAIIGFAIVSVGGALFLARTGVTIAEGSHAFRSANDIPVYSAPAVPFDLRPEDPAQRAASIARALSATQTQVHRAEETVDEQGTAPASEPTLLAEANRELRGFSGFPNFAGGNNFLAFTGTSVGISAQSAPSYAAPDAETLTAAPVPEASTWMCGGALFLLVAARGARAHWQRKRRRLR